MVAGKSDLPMPRATGEIADGIHQPGFLLLKIELAKYFPIRPYFYLPAILIYKFLSERQFLQLWHRATYPREPGLMN
jgi:hypothetical protein